MSEKKRRIGLWGGSFNPPTIAHKALANFAFSALSLDHLLWIVTPQNPEKDLADLAPFEHRLAMVQATLQNHPAMEASDIEHRLGSSYTLNTVKALRRDYPDDYLFFIMGTDNWLGYHLWDEDYKEIMDYVSLVIMQRPGYDLAAHAKASELFKDRQCASPMDMKPSGNWCIVDNPQMEIAATDARALLQQGEIPPQIEPDTLDYITAHSLYGV